MGTVQGILGTKYPEAEAFVSACIKFELAIENKNNRNVQISDKVDQVRHRMISQVLIVLIQRYISGKIFMKIRSVVFT